MNRRGLLSLSPFLVAFYHGRSFSYYCNYYTIHSGVVQSFFLPLSSRSFVRSFVLTASRHRPSAWISFFLEHFHTSLDQRSRRMYVLLAVNTVASMESMVILRSNFGKKTISRISTLWFILASPETVLTLVCISPWMRHILPAHLLFPWPRAPCVGVRPALRTPRPELPLRRRVFRSSHSPFVGLGEFFLFLRSFFVFIIFIRELLSVLHELTNCILVFILVSMVPAPHKPEPSVGKRSVDVFFRCWDGVRTGSVPDTHTHTERERERDSLSVIYMLHHIMSSS